MSQGTHSRLRRQVAATPVARWLWPRMQGAKAMPYQLWGKAWYWRSYPAEYLTLSRARAKHDGEYHDESAKPLVSVIIPTLNRGQLLVERTLPSVLAQTYQHLEVVIVGDHATDDTVGWISRVTDQRVKFYNLPSPPKYPDDPRKRWAVAGTAALNKAQEIARGHWIAPMDDDDFFTPDHVESLLSFAQAGNYEWVAGNFLEETAPGVLTPGIDASKNWTFRTRAIRTSWLYRSYLGCFKLDVHSWRYRLNGDQSLRDRFLRSGVRAAYLDHVVTHKLLSPGEQHLYGKGIGERQRSAW